MKKNNHNFHGGGGGYISNLQPIISVQKPFLRLLLQNTKSFVGRGLYFKLKTHNDLQMNS